jgi:hydrogenase/urease accessory protein HupE
MPVDANSLISLADLKTYLGIVSSTDDTLLEDCIDRASAVIERYLARKIKSRSLVEWYDTYGASRLVLKTSPVSSIQFVGVGQDAAITVGSSDSTDAAVSVSVNDTGVRLHRMTSAGAETTTDLAFATYTTTTDLAAAIHATAGFTATTILARPSRRLRRLAGKDLLNATVNIEVADETLVDYLADMDRGIIYGKQLAQYRSVVIEYTAGFATVPYDIEQAAMTVASRLYQGRKRDTGLASESIGDYSYNLRAGAEIDAEMKSMLQGWRTLR